jgi:hypothetical protein
MDIGTPRSGKGQLVFDLVTQFEAGNARLELDSIEIDAVGICLLHFYGPTTNTFCCVGRQAHAICAIQVRIRIHWGLNHCRLRE